MGNLIKLDVDGVNQLKSGFERVAGALRDARQDFGDDGSIRSNRINDALRDFNKDWSGKRDEIVKSLDDAAKFLNNVVEQMTMTDKALAAALSGARTARRARPAAQRTRRSAAG